MQRDVVFASAAFAASFAHAQLEIAYLVAGILGSALAPWFVLMTGSTFGLWTWRARPRDIAAMPALDENSGLGPGQRVIQLVREFHGCPPSPADWNALDEAAFDLYGMIDEGRIIIRNGLLRAGWQWPDGWRRSFEPVGIRDLQAYARAFLTSMDVWLSALNRRRIRAKGYDLQKAATHRVVRFVMEDRPCPSLLDVIELRGSLQSVLAKTSTRTKVDVASALVGKRELRVHAHPEVSIIRPVVLRHWLGACGLANADAVVRDRVRSTGAA